MNREFVKGVKKILKEMDCNRNYIDGVRYVIFLVCGFLYSLKLGKWKLLDGNFFDFMSKDVLHSEDLGILKMYSHYDLKHQEIANKVYNLIFEYKDKISYDNFVPANLYEMLLTSYEKKSLGQVYTPLPIVESMLTQTFEIKNVNKNTRILDPSCGGGYFLIEAFKKVRESISNEKYILEHMIYGIDVDDFAIFLSKMGLLFISSCTNVNFKIFKMDFLINHFNNDGINISDKINFDIIIGNPPYIGHKAVNKEYRAILKDKYYDVFYDKSDISYCFFKKGKELLKFDGILCLITSRYFMEAMYADKLREFIQHNFSIYSIEDYSGLRVFKSAMVSPLVITLFNKTLNQKEFSYIKYSLNNSQNEKFKYNQNKLKKSGWIILNNKEEELFNRIESISNSYISDVCSIKQGIITGLDKAFIVTEDVIAKYNIEDILLKKWIKNSNITKNRIKYNDLYLIYTDIIEDEKDFPNTINYLLPFKNELIKRRECRNGIRKWYELQWGRVLSDFESPKILFPYKSRGNNFYYDNEKFFCSADVYFINKIYNNLTFEYLHDYLNSNIFEFYFKCKAKKVGVDIYDYYPNKLKLMKIYVPDKKSGKMIPQNISKIGKFSIDNSLKKVFNISCEEEAIINKYIYKKGDDAK
ncbi:MAG: N-6 DNA methylase [Tissierellia bacterium]|nr:N-6 DNA methylase [Tissierellia bacterium]